MAGLVEAIDALVSVDSHGLDEAGLIDRMAVCRRAVNQLEALYLRDLEVLDRRGLLAAEHGSTQAWLRACGPGGPLDGRVAHRQVRLARDLADAMPATTAAMSRGELSVDHAQQIARLRPAATADSFSRAEPDLAAYGAVSTVSELRDAITTTLHSLAPDQLAADERDAYDRRELHASTSLNGIGLGNWTLDPVSHDRVLTALHAAAAPLPGGVEERTAGQRRADALVSVAEFFLKYATTDGALPTEHGHPPQLTVTVPLATLTRQPAAPAALTGQGTRISGEAARRLACDASVSRLITGPNSEPLDAGRASRTFTRAARRALTARDTHCRWKGCTAPAAWCDAHHIIHWADGGPSNLDNAILLCGRHHDQLHHHQHQVVIRPDGTRTVDLRRHRATRHGWLHDQRQNHDPPGG